MKNRTDLIDSRMIYDLLYHIRKRPHLWLTSKSISSLQDLITGYMIFGNKGYTPEEKTIYYEGDPDFDEFLYWINNEPFIPVHKGPPFSKYLLDKCSYDEEKAYNLFFDLLDEFKKIKGINENIR